MSLSKHVKLDASQQALVAAVSGGLGGMAGLAITYPLDTLKTRRQLQRQDTREVTLGEIFRQEGLGGIYAGMGIGLFQTAIARAFYFFYYDLFSGMWKRRFAQDQLTIGQNLLVGAMAGTLNQLCTLPLNTLHTRLQGIGKDERMSLTDTCRQIVREHGVAGLWHGLGPALALVINPTITFMVFDQLRSRIEKTIPKMSPFQVFLLGAFAKIVSTILTYPLILVKARLQGGKTKRKSFVGAMAETFSDNGVIGMYKGIEHQITKATVNDAIMFMLKDVFSEWGLALYLAMSASARKQYRLSKQRQVEIDQQKA